MIENLRFLQPDWGIIFMSHPLPPAPTRRWIRILISLMVGAVVAFLDYKSRNPGPGSSLAKVAEWLTRGTLSAIASALLAEIWAFKTSIDNLAGTFTSAIGTLASELESVREHALGDERIIFARAQLNRDSRPIAVVGIESVDPIPEALNYLPQCGPKKWERSISVLRFDRIQDLLFSPGYLEHFFSLPLRVKSTNRILIVNDIPRSKDAIKSFLQISAGVGIKTYIYKKSEFYTMLDTISEIVPPNDAKVVREVMAGNPELNLMVRTESEFNPSSQGKPISMQSDYVLRYLSSSGARKEVVTRAPGSLGLEVGTLPDSQVAWVLRIMTLALKDARNGVNAFERLVADNGAAPENYWSRGSLLALKNRQECA